MSNGFMSENRGRSPRVEFYLAANDRDLLSKVETLMRRKGLVGMYDAQGRVHFIIDGRRGSVYAERRVEDVARMLVGEQRYLLKPTEEQVITVIDDVLQRYYLPTHLNGYRYLRHTLQLTVLNGDKLYPLSKKAFHSIAQTVGVTSNGIDRDIRYLFEVVAKKVTAWLNGESFPECDQVKLGQTHADLTEDGKRLSTLRGLSKLHSLIVQELDGGSAGRGVDIKKAPPGAFNS